MKSINEVLTTIPLGVTNPFFCRVDGVNHVAKWEKCDEMHFPLVNEYIGYEICNRLGMELPPHDFVTISSEAVNQNKTELALVEGDLFFVSEQIRKSVKFNSGAQLATVDKSKLIEMMLIDVILCNKDRNEGNILLQKFPNQPVQFFAIDYSHAFYLGCLWSGQQFKRLLNDPSCLKDLDQYFYHEGYQIIFSSFTFSEEQIRAVADRMKSMVKHIDLDEIFLSLPQKLHTLCNDVDLQLFKRFIAMRLGEIDSITDEIIQYLSNKSITQPIRP